MPTIPAIPLRGRKSHRALALLGLLIAAFLATFADASWLSARRAPALLRQAQAVRDYGLTDLCLLPEARYTRHLSQADLHTAFQDQPAALDHFPAGSLVSPPPTLLEPHANLPRKTEVPH